MPRWVLNCYWRRDGEPIWQDPALYARELSGTAVDEAVAARADAGLLGEASTHDVLNVLTHAEQLVGRVVRGVGGVGLVEP